MSAVSPLNSLEASTVEELLDILLDFVDINKEMNVKRVLRFTCGLLNTNNNENLKLALKLIRKLIAVIIPETYEEDTHHPQLLADLLLCVDMWISHNPEKGKFLLNQLRTNFFDSKGLTKLGQTLQQLVDNFLCELGSESIAAPKLFHRVHKLLESKAYEQRKTALLILQMLVDQSSNDLKEQPDLDFYFNIIIMECVEVKESSLIPAPLGTQLSLLNETTNDENWLYLLYVKLLQTQDIQVLSLTLEFIMTHFTVAQLHGANLLVEFLAATNKLEVHNPEEYFLPERLMKKFTQSTENKQFLKAFGEVEWCGVALHHWLHCLEPKNQPQILKKLLLKLCELVRKIENVELKNSVSNRICEVFEKTIQSLSIGDYMSFIAVLFHNNQQNVSNYALYFLSVIIQNCNNISKELVHLTKNSYEMLYDNHYGSALSPFSKLLIQLENIPKSQHGWWRLPAFFFLHKNNNEAITFYYTLYDINMYAMKDYQILNNLQSYLINKLNCIDEDETIFVRQHCVDLYLQQKVKTWQQFEEFYLNPIELIQNCTFETLLHLTNLFGSHNKRLQDNKILETFLVVTRKYPKRLWTTGNILKYVIEHLDQNETENLIDDMIANSTDGWELDKILMVTKSLSRDRIIKGLLDSETSMGERRIENAFLNSLSTWNVLDLMKRNIFIAFAYKMEEEDLFKLFDELLSINANIIQNKKVLENSKDHRIQMRIARALFAFEPKSALLPDYLTSKLWTALFSANNQQNITFLYECLLAKLLPSFELLLEKLETLSNLQPHQQASVISVVYIYACLYLCPFNWICLQPDQLQKVFQLLSQETMFFSQLVLHRLAVRCEKNRDFSTEIPMAASIKDNLEILLKDKVIDGYTEVRLYLSQILQMFPPAGTVLNSSDTVLYVTNAPFDEYDCPKWSYSHGEMVEIEKLRDVLKKIHIEKSLL